MQDLIEYIALSLVNDPLHVRVSQFQRGTNVEIRLQVAKEDRVEPVHLAVRDGDSLRSVGRSDATQEAVLPPQQFHAFEDGGAGQQFLLQHGLAKDFAELLLPRVSLSRSALVGA